MVVCLSVSGPSLTACLPLSPQVSRLFRQRAAYRAKGKEALEQLQRVQALLDNIDLDFTVSDL